MEKGCAASNGQRRFKVELFVVHVPISFQVLIDQEIAGMGGDDTASHDIGPFPKPKQSFLLVKDLRDASDS